MGILGGKGNGLCDDSNNNAGCEFDGGDCCISESTTLLQNCNICACLTGEDLFRWASPRTGSTPGQGTLWDFRTLLLAKISKNDTNIISRSLKKNIFQILRTVAHCGNYLVSISFCMWHFVPKSIKVSVVLFVDYKKL